MTISQEQVDVLKARIARDASTYAQADIEYLNEQGIVPTPALLAEIAARRAKLYWASIEAEIQQRVSAGMSAQQALEDYLATLMGKDDPLAKNDENTLKHVPTPLIPEDRKDTPIMTQRRYARLNRARRLIDQHSAIPKIFVGLLLLLFFVIGSILHIMTSEAFFLGGSSTSLLSTNWQILTQPFLLATGTLPGGPNMQKAVIWGWGIELVFLICVFGYDRLHRNVKASSRPMAKIFRAGTVLLIFFDGWSDFNYVGAASGPWGQLGFTLITAFVVFYFGTAGFHLVSEGLSELTEKFKEDDDYDD